jgi:hypothetical protein
MRRSTQTKNQQQHGRATDFYIYLARNIVQIGILLALVVGGIIAFIVQDIEGRQEVRKVVKPELANKDWLEWRYGHADCARDPYCRQLKRICAEGGASQEAIRENILAADKTVTFEQLQENAARYEGTPWAFEGKIIDIIYQDSRGIADYVLADVIIGDDPGKQISVKGDFTTDFAENDYVYVVGYMTGTSHPRLGPSSMKYKGNVPGLCARALLRPSEARELLKESGTN